MKCNTTILRNPATLLVGLPVRTNKSKCFTKDNIHLVSESNSNMNLLYVDINDSHAIAVLQNVLQKINVHADWLNYLQIETLYFHWMLGNQEFGSSNPHFELFMRSLTLLLGFLNSTISGEYLPTQEEMESIVQALNTSLIGLGLCELQIPAIGPLNVPALLNPPFIRESHSRTFDEKDVSILPDISVHLLRCLTHTLVAEIWMAEIQSAIYDHLQEPRNNSFMRYGDTKEYYDCIYKVTKDVLLDKRNPLLADKRYSQYVKARLSPANKNSDATRLYAIANALTIKSQEISPKFLKYIRDLSPCFSTPVSCILQSKLQTTLSTAETENGRLKPKVFAICTTSPNNSEEDWALAMQETADSNTKGLGKSDYLLDFDIEPIYLEPKYDSSSNLEICHTGDTHHLLEERENKRLKPIKYFCCM